MILSQTAEYALQAATVLARHDGATMEVGALAETLGLPRNYLSKTLAQLTRAGVLASTRGKGGGFRLARPAAAISLMEVVAPFDRLGEPTRCLLGQLVCHDRAACPAHVPWKAVTDRVSRFFTRTTLADAARGRIRWPNHARTGRTRARGGGA